MGVGDDSTRKDLLIYGARSLRSLAHLSPAGLYKTMLMMEGSSPGWWKSDERLHSRQIPRSVPIAVGPSAHGSANLAGPIELAELYRTSYLASSEHDDDKKERYKTNAPWSTLRRAPPS